MRRMRAMLLACLYRIFQYNYWLFKQLLIHLLLIFLDS